jgi:hypothetical protein
MLFAHLTIREEQDPKDQLKVHTGTRDRVTVLQDLALYE